MDVSNDTDDTTNTTSTHTAPNGVMNNDDTDTDTDAKHLSSSPPSTPPSTDAVDATPLDEHLTSSSPDRRTDLDEQPIIINPEFLQTVTAMVEQLQPRRVKVYELRGEVWVDLGTGFCQGLVANVCFSPL